MRDVFEHVEAKEQLKLACPLAKESDGVGSELDRQTFLHRGGDLPGITLHASEPGEAQFPECGQRVTPATADIEHGRGLVRRQVRTEHAPVEGAHLHLMLRGLRMPAAVVVGIVNVHG